MAEPEGVTENRLARETSPYLLQHRHNPVDWHPWGQAALDEAEAASKPILLSVGYAACHWCHVMAHECFEDPAIAAIMNSHFVNVKVDREERPDVDAIYQSALALLGEQGGWPLTMFLTPQGDPFWGGTYFPPEPRYGRPGFPQILERVAELYVAERNKIASNVGALRDGLEKLSRNQRGAEITLAEIEQIAQRLVDQIDPQQGGIGGPPKFPQPTILKLLWRAWKRGGNVDYRDAVALTLMRMSQGGIYDHLGGGYARYTVDGKWLVPHFEKMLYDNAQMIDLLTWAWQDTGEPLFEQRLRETVGWVLSEMIAPQSAEPGAAPSDAFASTLDADSEGEEGRFYVWTEAEIDAALGQGAAAFKAAYDVTPEGNWEGKTILNRSHEPTLGTPETEAQLARARDHLLEIRDKRVRPGWDDKVLADWNGLMITALTRAALAVDAAEWLEAAQDAFDFVAERMVEDGRLRHSWRHGVLKHPASVDDYANMTEAALVLYEATGRVRYLIQAEAWIGILDAHYWDTEAGGYFFSADDTSDVPLRTKNVYDNAVPAGNGVLVGVLIRLFHLTGKESYAQRANDLVAAFAGEIGRNFFPLSTFLNGCEFRSGALQIVVRGQREAPDTQALLRIIWSRCLPNLVLQVLTPSAELPLGHPAEGKELVGDKATVYICRGQTCSLPITDPDELRQALSV